MTADTTPTPLAMPMMPFSQEAEEAVIGSVLISPTLFPALSGMLRPQDFYLLRHTYLWSCFEGLTERGEVIDLTSVGGDLMASGKLELIGGPAFLIRLVQTPANSLHAESYAKLVQRLSLRRGVIETGHALTQSGAVESLTTEAVIGTAERSILDLRRRQMAYDVPTLSIQDAVDAKREALWKSVEIHRENPQYVIGVRTGITDLDVLLDGLRPGVTTLAAATSMGKTAFTLQLAQFASRNGRVRALTMPANTLFFSGEMTQDQLMNRLLSSITGIPVRHIERGHVSREQLVQIEGAFDDLTLNHRLSFESGKRLNTSQIRQRVRTLVIDNSLDLLVLDGLLQLEEAPTTRRAADKRRDMIETIMNDLEDISLTYNVPILLTHQLSRAPSSRGDKRPILSDLAEASFVEQKSAVILFLYREGYYTASADPNAAEIIVAKNRHGGTGTILAYFDRLYTRFLNADKHHISLGGS